MVSQSTIDRVKNSGERYFNTLESVISQWHNHCGCLEPGLEAKCQTCPYFIEHIQQLQSIIDPDAKADLAVLLPPELSPPYSSEFKRICLEMFGFGYGVSRIKELTGINSLTTLRRWLEQSGLYKKAEEYSFDQKQECLDLYQEGKTPLEIEEITRISGNVIRHWVSKAGIARPKNHYTPEQQQQAVLMYSMNIPYLEIEAATGVPRSMIRKFARKAKASRKRKGKAATYSKEFKQQCFDLLAQGLKPSQVGEQLGVAADTVRKWHKQHREQQQKDLGE